VIVKLRTSKWP